MTHREGEGVEVASAGCEGGREVAVCAELRLEGRGSQGGEVRVVVESPSDGEGGDLYVVAEERGEAGATKVGGAKEKGGGEGLVRT